MAGAGVLVLDLVLEVAELDLAGGVAQVGAVDRRAGLHADLGLAGEAVDRDVVDAGLALADDAGELDREHRADAGGDAVLPWWRRPCRRRRPGESVGGVDGAREDALLEPGKFSAPKVSGEKPASATSCSEPIRTTLVSSAMPARTASATAPSQPAPARPGRRRRRCRCLWSWCGLPMGVARRARRRCVGPRPRRTVANPAHAVVLPRPGARRAVPGLRFLHAGRFGPRGLCAGLCFRFVALAVRSRSSAMVDRRSPYVK